MHCRTARLSFAAPCAARSRGLRPARRRRQRVGAGWPAKPIRLVTGFAPGGAADYVARTMRAIRSAVLLGQSVVVREPGRRGQQLAADFVAKAPPDGYTLLIAMSQQHLGQSGAECQTHLQRKGSAAGDARHVVAAGRRGQSGRRHQLDPGADRCRQGQARRPQLHQLRQRLGPHLGAAHFSKIAGVEMVHIPYKGGARRSRP
jgi:hypothetical protein